MRGYTTKESCPRSLNLLCNLYPITPRVGRGATIKSNYCMNNIYRKLGVTIFSYVTTRKKNNSCDYIISRNINFRSCYTDYWSKWPHRAVCIILPVSKVI